MHKRSFDKAEEKENLTLNQSEIIKISPMLKPKTKLQRTFDISSIQLEELVSFYTDDNNKNL
jgi:hypothetical protein